MAGLNKKEISRYSRQLILPEWGVKGQAAVKDCAVLIVGVGGLGSPAGLYLAAAGIGHLGLLDYDVVDLSNLHRQVLHSEKTEGVSKVESAQKSLSVLNSMVKCTTHHVLLSKDNAMEILSRYDVILDCTDNVSTRYLLNDACVLLGKPLVSGSALRFEGQLTVYHHGGGPCFRCLFPSPPPPATVTNCSEGGVMGPVPGIIGTMQALEALKITADVGSSLAGQMLVFDGLSLTFRMVKLRSRSVECAVCGDKPSIVQLVDYEAFCGASANDGIKTVTLLDDQDRISCQNYHDVLESSLKHMLLDVREKGEFEICHLQNAINIPLRVLQSHDGLLHIQAALGKVMCSPADPASLYVCCHHGNDSQVAVLHLRDALLKQFPGLRIKDLKGGLTEWANTVDHSFPHY